MTTEEKSQELVRLWSDLAAAENKFREFSFKISDTVLGHNLAIYEHIRSILARKLFDESLKLKADE